MKIEKRVLERLKKLKYHIGFSESMTGGLLASRVINVKGASDIIERSFITYSNEAKIDILGVSKETIEKYDVVSKEVTFEMVKGTYNLTKAEVCASVSGYADGYLKGKGKVCFSIKYLDNIYSFEKIISGSRNIVRKKATTLILKEIYNVIKGV